MLDRALKSIVTLTLLMFLVEAVVGTLRRVLGEALARATSTIGFAGSFAGNLLAAVAAMCVSAGLLIRLIHWLRDGGLSGRRLHRGTSTRQEWAGREFADEVPVHRTTRRAKSRRRVSPRGERA